MVLALVKSEDVKVGAPEFPNLLVPLERGSRRKIEQCVLFSAVQYHGRDDPPFRYWVFWGKRQEYPYA